jgi:thioredoxin-like negative regulator of GroEL
VFTLTTDNFELITKDWTKDVLVLFYGPRCQYSKYASLWPQ